MKVEIQDQGVMCVDYFWGTNGVMLPLTIDNTTTISEIIASLENEINMVWDHIEYQAEYHGFTGCLDSAIDAELASIRAENAGKMDTVFMPDLEFHFNDIDENDYHQYPVLILTIEFIEE